MKEQDKAAYESFVDSMGHGGTASLEAWIACCEYKDKQAAQAEPVGYWDGEFSKDGGATLYEVPQESVFGHKYRNIPLFHQAPAVAQGEPIHVTDSIAYAFHNALDDSSLSQDDVELIKKGLQAALVNVPAVAVNETDLDVLRELAATLEFRSPERHKALSKLIAAAEAAKGGV